MTKADALVYDRSGFVAEIEQNVLGSLMLVTGEHEALSLLKEYHFVARFHQEVFLAIKTARERYNSSRPVMVKRLLTEHQVELFEKNNGYKLDEYITHLLGASTSTSSGLIENSRKVIEQWARLSLAGEAGNIQAAANDPMADVRAISREAAQRIDDIMSEVRSGAARRSRVSIGRASQRAIESAAEARSNGSGLTGITWGLSDLNRMTGGIQRKDLTLIGARPSMGKTTVALSVAMRAAKAGNTVGITSLEMDSEKVAARALSDFLYDWNTRIPYQDIIRGNMSEEQLDAIAAAQLQIDTLPLVIDDQSGQTVSDIYVRTEKMLEDSTNAGSPLSMLIVDHLGLVKPSSRYSGNRTNEIAEITGGLKALARELDIAVVLLSQLSRDLEKRENKRPQLSDLRDSGAIEQDADMVAFLFRESYYLERDQGGSYDEKEERIERLLSVQNKLEFIIAKQRNGPLGTIDLFADMAFSAVRNGARQ